MEMYKNGEIDEDTLFEKTGLVNSENYRNALILKKDLEMAKYINSVPIKEDEYERLIHHIDRAIKNNERIYFTETENKKIFAINTIKITYNKDLTNVIVMGQIDNV